MYSIDHAINAGLDLEIPGTSKWRSIDLVTRSIGSRKITQRTLKERARKVLELVQRCAKEAPEVIFVFRPLLGVFNHLMFIVFRL